MGDYRFNKPYFELELSEVDDPVHVFSFEGEEEVSGSYEYRITLISENPALDSSKILNNHATFILHRGEYQDPVKIHGIISQFEQRGKTSDYVWYNAVLVPRMWLLTLTHENVVFQDTDINGIIADILARSHLKTDEYRIDAEDSYPSIEYAIQYSESDFNFLNRRLEHFGIFYFFDQQYDGEVIVFGDRNEHFIKMELEEDIKYNPNRDPLAMEETVMKFAYQGKVVTGTVRLKDYNYEHPNKNLVVESNIKHDDPGTYYEYGCNFIDHEEGELLARIRNEEILSKSTRFTGISDCRLFRAGHVFTLDRHYQDDWNSDYVVTKVKSRGNQKGIFGSFSDTEKVEPTYENTFEAIPYKLPFRPERCTPVPRIPGVITTRVENGRGDQYADVDDQGRYRVKLPFDLRDDVAEGKATKPVRLIQPYSGANYGVHLPNHRDTEMIIACENGDVDRPIALGTVPNTANASPVTEKNNSQNIISTKAGNEFIMDDREEKAKISVRTPDNNAMVMDDEEDKVEIATTEKHTFTLDDKNQNIKITTKEGHTAILDDENQRVIFQSKNGHRISINDADGGENITLIDESGKNSFMIDITNEKLVINTDNGNIDIHAPNGIIDMKAAEFNVETTGDTSMKAANINSEAQVDHKTKATNISQDASMDMKQSGMNVSSEASMEHKTKGMNVSSEAGVKQDLKGSLITVQASGVNTIQGSLVKIN